MLPHQEKEKNKNSKESPKAFDTSCENLTWEEGQETAQGEIHNEPMSLHKKEQEPAPASNPDKTVRCGPKTIDTNFIKVVYFHSEYHYPISFLFYFSTLQQKEENTSSIIQEGSHSNPIDTVRCPQ